MGRGGGEVQGRAPNHVGEATAVRGVAFAALSVVELAAVALHGVVGVIDLIAGGALVVEHVADLALHEAAVAAAVVGVQVVLLHDSRCTHAAHDDAVVAPHNVERIRAAVWSPPASSQRLITRSQRSRKSRANT